MEAYYEARAREYDDWYLGVNLYEDRDRLVVVDSARSDETPAERMDERVLSDGSRWEVYKRWFRGEELAHELGGGHVLHAGRYFVAVEA